MNLAETAVLAVTLKLNDQLSGGVAKAEGELAGLNTTTKASGAHLTSLAGAANVARGGVVKFGGALGHAKSQLVSLATGPLGLIGVGAGLFSLAGLFEKSVGKAQEFGAEVIKLSKLTGMTVETTSSLAAALEHFGVGSDKALQSIGFLEKNVGLMAAGSGTKALKFLDDFGFNIKQGTFNVDALNNAIETEKSKTASLTEKIKAGNIIADFQNAKVKDANTLLLQSADYFNNKTIPASTKAAALAKLYGRSWQQLIPFLSAGSKGIRDAEAAAAELGLTLTKTNVEDLKKFKESTRELGTAVGGLELQIGLALVPAMKDLADAATSFVRDNRQGIVSFFKQAIEAGRTFAGVVTGTLLPAFKQVAGAAIGFWDSIPGPLKDLIVKGYVGNKVLKFVFGIDVIGSIVGGIETGISRGLGAGLAQAGIGKLFVQPVFVTNPGFGAAGGAIPAVEGLGAAAAGSLAIPVILTAATIAALSIAFVSAMQQVPEMVPTSRGGTPGQVFSPGHGFGPRQFGPGGQREILDVQDNSPEARQERSDIKRLARTAMDNLRQSEREDWTGLVSGIDKLHADLKASIAALNSDDVKLADALKGIVTAITGGAGGAKETTNLVADLKRRRDEASAAGRKDIAQSLTDAINKIEPFAKGRQWQQDQIAEARKIVASNKTVAQKTAALKTIEDSLLAHQRTMAANIVQGLVDVQNAIINKEFKVATVYSGNIGYPSPTKPIHIPTNPHRAGGGPVRRMMGYIVGERGPEWFSPDSNGKIETTPFKDANGRWWPSKSDWMKAHAMGTDTTTVGNFGRARPDPIQRLTVKVTTSTRDQTTAATVRRRWGPTPTQAGAG